MEFGEYVERQRSIATALASLLLRMLWPFRVLKMTESGWLSLLRAMYPEVERARRESAALARQFYDSQRALYVGTDDRWDVDLASYEFEWFEEAMRPSKRAIMAEEASEGVISQAVLRAVKEVENGGRRTLLRPVTDPERRDPVVKGWTRVATGRETCAFCLMLVSRGPVYFSAEDAGLDLDDTSALELIDEGNNEALQEAMKRWHPGCDCKVVPVFDRKRWPGRDAYLKAEKLWVEATRGHRGRDALNALRRAIESGEVNPRDIAAAA